jgi:hypothetical protein
LVFDRHWPDVLNLSQNRLNSRGKPIRPIHGKGGRILAVELLINCCFKAGLIRASERLANRQSEKIERRADSG